MCLETVGSPVLSGITFLDVLKVLKGISLGTLFNLNWLDWITYNLLMNMDWKVVFSVAIRHIWRARNRVVFALKMTKPFLVFNAFFVDYVTTNNILQGKGVGNFGQRAPAWKKPAEGYLKLNIDGSWKAKDKAEGGGVLRLNRKLVFRICK